MRVDIHVSASKEYLLGVGRRLGLTDKALHTFSYAATDVRLTLEVKRSGLADIVAVDGMKLTAEQPKR